jgi:hypothetical protein
MLRFRPKTRFQQWYPLLISNLIVSEMEARSMTIRWLCAPIAVTRLIVSRYNSVRYTAGALLGSFILTSVLLTAASTASPEKVQGVLIDKECSYKAETHMVSSPSPHMEGGMLWAYTHTRQCALLTACQKSGYGIFTRDDNYLTFDPAGNQKALALLRATKKTEDLEIEVTGTIDGDKIKVATLKFL